MIDGATGFIGSHLAARLIEENFNKVIVLARGTSKEDPGERMRKRLYDLGCSAENMSRVFAFNADLTKEHLGTHCEERKWIRQNKGDGVHYFHVGADIRFRVEEREEIFETNLLGTRNALEFASNIGVDRFFHFSTAYIWGNYQGIAFEDECWRGQGFRNPYEESKFKAEELVWEAGKRFGFHATIFRPSIVVGNSATGKTQNYEGYYKYMRGFENLKQFVVSKMSSNPEKFREEGIYFENDVLHLPITIWGRPKATVNLVCVDYVIDQVVNLMKSRMSAGKTFHIINPKPPEYGWLLETGLKVLGVTGVKVENPSRTVFEYVKEHRAKPPLVQKLEDCINKQLEYYVDYVSGEPEFSTASVQAVLGKKPVHPKVNEALIKTLLSYGSKAKWKTTLKKAA